MKKILSMILVLCMALTLTAPAFADGKSPVDGMTVAFIPKVSGNSFFEAANDGAQKYAAEWGLTVDYIGSPDASVTTQLELIQQAIDKGVDAICISSVDATGLDEKLMEAQDAGIYVSTWDSDVSPNARALMISQGTADVLGPMLVEMGVESLKERGYKPEDNKLKAGIFGAEPWTEEMRKSIQESLGIKAYDIYGLTETSGPGVAFECSEQSGMHINEDHFIPEIIDPNTGEVLPDGTKGELVFTSITKEAFPLLRYRTRDICVLSRKKCSCGRTFIKMAKPMGRSDDMLIIKGVNVFPSQVEAVLLEQGYQANYQIIVDRVNHSDTMEVQVEMTPENFSDSLAKITEMEKSLVAALKTMLGIYAKVKLVAPKSITRSEGKAVRVIDKRKI